MPFPRLGSDILVRAVTKAEERSLDIYLLGPLMAGEMQCRGPLALGSTSGILRQCCILPQKPLTLPLNFNSIAFF